MSKLEKREEVSSQKDEDSRLQRLYNRRRAAQQVIREIDKLIAEEKKRLTATN